MKKNWNEQTKFEKTLVISRIIVSLVILFAAIMKFLNVWNNGLDLAIPLFSVYYLLETIGNWNSNKDMAAFSLFMAIIIVAISCAVFLL